MTTATQQTLRQQQYGICTQMDSHVTLVDRTAPKVKDERFHVGTSPIVKDFGICPNDLSLGCDCEAHTAISKWLLDPSPSDL